MNGSAVRPSVAIGFRCRAGETYWHFCENCRGWPDAPDAFEEWSGPLPHGSQICPTCLDHRSGSNCRLRTKESGFTR